MSGALTLGPTLGPPPGPPPTDLDLLRDNAALLVQAETALARRRKSYPGLIEKDEMSPADAAADIAAWELLVGEYQWICSPTGQVGACPPSWTRHDRIDAVNLALDRVALALASTPHDPALLHQRDLYRAMHWHLTHHFHGVLRSHWLASLNHELRARTGGMEPPLPGRANSLNINPVRQQKEPA